MERSHGGAFIKYERTPPEVYEDIEKLKSPSREIRASAALAMGRRASSKVPARPALIEALKDKETFVRFNASFALGQMGHFAAPATPHLVELLKDDDSGVRSSAANAMSKIGFYATSAVPRLLEFLEDEDKEVRGWAAYTLGEIAPKLERQFSLTNDIEWAQKPIIWGMIFGRPYSTREVALTQEMLLWQKALKSLETRDRTETLYSKTFEKADAAVRRLVGTLQKKQQNR